MILAETYEQVAAFVRSEEATVFFFTADWCPDCQYIYPAMPEIEATFPQARFVRLDRDDVMDLAQEWDIYGIPSLVVTRAGKELGRLVNKQRKTKEELISFLQSVLGG